MPVRWSEPALDDLSSIKAYIAKDSPPYARRFIERIFDAAEKLADFPELGRKVPEADYQDHIREIFFQNYRIIYLNQDGGINILGVIHGSRDLANLPGKPWEVG
jgi:plasmid stabilization system protein ParE